MEFIKNEMGRNEVLDGGDFFISFNPQTGVGHGFLTDIANSITGLGFKDGTETALKHNDGDWMILEGDFRKEYLDAFPNGYEACVEVYKKNIDKRSNWSTD